MTLLNNKIKNLLFIFSNNNKDGTIKERDLTIEGLRSEISRLQANLSMFKNQKEIYEFQITVSFLKELKIFSIHPHFSACKVKSQNWLANLMPWSMPLLLSRTVAWIWAVDLPLWRRSWDSRLMFSSVSWLVREGKPILTFHLWIQGLRMSMPIGEKFLLSITL